MKKIFFNKLKKISLKRFQKYNKKELLKIILNGNIIIVKNAVNKNSLLSVVKKINKKKMKLSKSVKMHEGVKNIYYESKPPKKNSKKSKRYIVSNRSWYFFPWNKDKTGLVKLVQPVYNKVIGVNGYDPKLILSNSPKDGMIQRFHLMNYPIGNGFISRHVDSSEIVKVTACIYITKYRKNYDAGGFYVFDKKRNKKNIDQFIKSSDMVLFYPSMPHGVDSISRKKKQKNYYFEDGRWFLNLTLVFSHHVKNREVSVGY